MSEVVDQAESLRKLMDSRGQSAQTRGFSFVGSRNGVGVSTILAKLAERLSEQGQRVLVVEPEIRARSIASFFSSSAHGGESSRTEPGLKRRLLTQLKPGIYLSGEDTEAALASSRWDCVLIDEGVDSESVHFVVTPDLASIESSLRKMETLSKNFGVREFNLIVNRVTSESDAEEVLSRLKSGLRQDTVSSSEIYLEAVFFEDESLRESVMKSKSLLEWKAEGLERILSMAEGNRPIEILG